MILFCGVRAINPGASKLEEEGRGDANIGNGPAEQNKGDILLTGAVMFISSRRCTPSSV